MIKNFDQPLKDIEGNDLLDNNKPVSMKKVILDAILAVSQDESNLDGETKAKRYKLAQKIVVGGDIDLSIDELKEIKERVGKFGVPLVVGQIYEYMEAANGVE